jgi:hypothetical protein
MLNNTHRRHSLLLLQNSSVSKKILDALQSASDSLGSDNVKVKHAAPSNPGVPPSSLMSFMRKVHLLFTKYLSFASLFVANHISRINFPVCFTLKIVMS